MPVFSKPVADADASTLLVDTGNYHIEKSGTKRQYRKLNRAACNAGEAKKQRRDVNIAKRLNKTTATLDFYEKKSTRVKCCCMTSNCLVSLMGHADEQDQLSPEQLVMKDSFMRQVCASRLVPTITCLCSLCYYTDDAQPHVRRPCVSFPFIEFIPICPTLVSSMDDAVRMNKLPVFCVGGFATAAPSHQVRSVWKCNAPESGTRPPS